MTQADEGHWHQVSLSHVMTEVNMPASGFIRHGTNYVIQCPECYRDLDCRVGYDMWGRSGIEGGEERGTSEGTDRTETERQLANKSDRQTDRRD